MRPNITIWDPVDDIADFHEKFALEYNGPPRHIPSELFNFRKMFMQEELNEYQHHEPLHEQLDALVDLVYVALGSAYLHGFNFREAWRRVHEANMKKVRVNADLEGSTRKSPYDVVKPEGWRPPDLTDLV